jgi:hypothetical protein
MPSQTHQIGPQLDRSYPEIPCLVDQGDTLQTGNLVLAEFGLFKILDNLSIKLCPGANDIKLLATVIYCHFMVIPPFCVIKYVIMVITIEWQ